VLQPIGENRLNGKGDRAIRTVVLGFRAEDSQAFGQGVQISPALPKLVGRYGKSINIVSHIPKQAIYKGILEGRSPYLIKILNTKF